MPDFTSTPIVPRGIIVQWTDLIANIPLGWQICDGTNSTPDLRGKFPRGVHTNASDPGTTGGEDTHVLVTAELPVHNHGTTETAHTHSIDGTNAGTFANRISVSAYPFGSTDVTSSDPLAGVSVGNTGGGGAHENRPAYLEVIHIMKVSSF